MRYIDLVLYIVFAAGTSAAQWMLFEDLTLWYFINSPTAIEYCAVVVAYAIVAATSDSTDSSDSSVSTDTSGSTDAVSSGLDAFSVIF